ncbi:MAG TPA: GNAT family N-acetyltransferase [Solirubrobacteraceae bacterium]|nr:GNAT family N-acetyltransferase [Solirubrobacteraceae bacterium]
MSEFAIRPARLVDGPALAQIDHDTWDPAGSPAPRWAPDADFFGRTRRRTIVLVADAGAPVGYVKLVPASALQSHWHIREIHGLAVARGFQGRGIGRALVKAGIEAAGADGVRRVRLRVLATNAPAVRLYESLGFTCVVRLAEEFWIDGRFVDDLVMSYSVSSSM